jgi:uncharacterized protein YaaQ
MVTAVIQEEDSEPLVTALLDSGFHATKVASTGGFLHRGNVTLLVGVEDPDLDLLIELVRKNCHARTITSGNDQIPVGGAVIFVQEISQYHRV